MGYSKRDLRAADMLALIFVGLGLALFAYGIVGWVGAKDSSTDGAKPRDGKDGEKIVAPERSSLERASPGGAKAPTVADEKKASEGSGAPDVVSFILGTVFLALGGAVHLKVRQLQRNGGEEPPRAEF